MEDLGDRDIRPFCDWYHKNTRKKLEITMRPTINKKKET
jgi:hypothetical protein